MSKEVKENKKDDKGRKEGKGAPSEMEKRFKQNPFVFTGTLIVLVLVIVTFVFWGAGDWILPNRNVLGDEELTFGYYEDIPIELKPGTFFADERQWEIQYYAYNGWRGAAAEKQATRTAFQKALFRAAVLDEMKKAKYEPPQELINKLVSELSKYQENGAFSVLKYKQESEADHIKTVKEVKENFIYSRYLDDLFGTGREGGDYDEEGASGSTFKSAFLVSDAEAEFIGSMASRERSFKLAVFPVSSYPDAEITAFAEKNPLLFKKVKLSQISLSSSEADANKVRSSIESGTVNFVEAAKSQSKDAFAAEGGDTGERISYELENFITNEKDFEVIIDLKSGVLSPVVKTSGGWSFFKAEADAAPLDLSDAAVLSKLRDYMLKTQRGAVDEYFITKAEKFREDVLKASGASAEAAFERTALADSLTTASFGPLPINFGDNANFVTLSSFGVAALSSASENADFWRLAFSTPAGTCSAPFVLDDIIVLFPVNETEGDSGAAEKSTAYFKDSFIKSDLESSLDRSILEGPKVRDNFEVRYASLFGNR